MDFLAFLIGTDTTTLSEQFGLLIQQYDYWKVILQMALVLAGLLWLYYKIRKTYVSQLIRGFVFIILVYLLTRILRLDVLSTILAYVLQISIIGAIIVFQPEIRRFLAYLGRRDVLVRNLFAKSRTQNRREHVTSELVLAAQELSESKTGALIVLEVHNDLDSMNLKHGTTLDAEVSKELLTALFYPKSPLHDGAVVIDENGRLVAAGVVLPLSESNLDKHLGTRHRAAVGISEKLDSMCLVISEETGNISLVYRGILSRINSSSELKGRLKSWYGEEEDHSLRNFSLNPLTLFGILSRHRV